MSIENNPDFEGLEQLNLTPEVLESIKQARLEARQIINSLDPRHINSWGDLITRLASALENAQMNSNILNSQSLRDAKKR